MLDQRVFPVWLLWPYRKQPIVDGWSIHPLCPIKTGEKKTKPEFIQFVPQPAFSPCRIKKKIWSERIELSFLELHSNVPTSKLRPEKSVPTFHSFHLLSGIRRPFLKGVPLSTFFLTEMSSDSPTLSLSNG